MTPSQVPAPPPAADAGEEHVLDASGHFHTTDAPVDISGYRFEDWFTFGVFWLLALDVFYQFFTRYVLDDSAAWTEEIARYLLIVVTFVGASMAVRRNTHIHVEFVYRYLPAGVGRVLSTAVDVVRVLFLGYATWLAVTLDRRLPDELRLRPRCGGLRADDVPCGPGGLAALAAGVERARAAGRSGRRRLSEARP